MVSKNKIIFLIKILITIALLALVAVPFTGLFDKYLIKKMKKEVGRIPFEAASIKLID